jgi:membrane peptidoglycan carboxypeptidase
MCTRPPHGRGPVDPSPFGLPLGEATPPPRRGRRWRRLLARVTVIAVFWTATATATGAPQAYVESVPIPAIAPQPEASVLYYRDGHTILARVAVTDHGDVPLSEVAVPVGQAVFAVEDPDFYDHPGVSRRGVLRAAVADVHGGHEGACRGRHRVPPTQRPQAAVAGPSGLIVHQD